jgi:hypothetical protein
MHGAAMKNEVTVLDMHYKEKILWDNRTFAKTVNKGYRSTKVNIIILILCDRASWIMKVNK